MAGVTKGRENNLRLLLAGALVALATAWPVAASAAATGYCYAGLVGTKGPLGISDFDRARPGGRPGRARRRLGGRRRPERGPGRLRRVAPGRDEQRPRQREQSPVLRVRPPGHPGHVRPARRERPGRAVRTGRGAEDRHRSGPLARLGRRQAGVRPDLAARQRGRLTPVATAENFDGGAPGVVNTFSYSVAGIKVATRAGGVWRSFTGGQLRQDDGPQAVRSAAASFVAQRRGRQVGRGTRRPQAIGRRGRNAAASGPSSRRLPWTRWGRVLSRQRLVCRRLHGCQEGVESASWSSPSFRRSAAYLSRAALAQVSLCAASKVALEQLERRAAWPVSSFAAAGAGSPGAFRSGPAESPGGLRPSRIAASRAVRFWLAGAVSRPFTCLVQVQALRTGRLAPQLRGAWEVLGFALITYCWKEVSAWHRRDARAAGYWSAAEVLPGWSASHVSHGGSRLRRLRRLLRDDEVRDRDRGVLDARGGVGGASEGGKGDRGADRGGARTQREDREAAPRQATIALEGREQSSRRPALRPVAARPRLSFASSFDPWLRWKIISFHPLTWTTWSTGDRAVSKRRSGL